MKSQEVFVFGSNLAGRHGKGAALAAMRHHGAQRGLGEGLSGNSYALPTKDAWIKKLPLDAIRGHVEIFLTVARQRPDLRFMVTAIGCGLAGYEPLEIAPMFEPALELENVYLPVEFCAALATTTRVSFDHDGKRIAR